MATAPSISYSITIRLEVPSGGSAVSELTTTVERTGGIVTALDVTASGAEALRIDLTCATSDTDHAALIVSALAAISDVKVDKVSDRTFLMHLGGVIETATKHPLRNRDDLSMIYTPGVARICMAIAADKEDARRLTVKRNSVAVVSDGSAVLGLGNIGPHAAMPVMEGKAALFKGFADIDAWPICLDTQDVDQIVETVAAISPGFAGINLEDISAPRCFEIEARLRERLDIPVFHDDQHGTAVVVLAALRNALQVVSKDIGSARIVLAGAGAAGTAVLKVLMHAGAKHVVVCDVDLISPALLTEWAMDPNIGDVPLIAVSLTRRPEDLPPVELLGVAGVLYLPALERSQVKVLLAGAHRPRGVTPPIGWRSPMAADSISAR